MEDSVASQSCAEDQLRVIPFWAFLVHWSIIFLCTIICLLRGRVFFLDGVVGWCGILRYYVQPTHEIAPPALYITWAFKLEACESYWDSDFCPQGSLIVTVNRGSYIQGPIIH